MKVRMKSKFSPENKGEVKLEVRKVEGEEELQIEDDLCFAQNEDSSSSSCLICLTSLGGLGSTGTGGGGGIGAQGWKHLWSSSIHLPTPNCGPRLATIFLVRNLLQVSREEVATLLTSSGTGGGGGGEVDPDPGAWCALCDNCAGLVEQAVALYQDCLKLQRRVEGIGEQLRGRVKNSWQNSGKLLLEPPEGGADKERSWNAHTFIRNVLKKARTSTNRHKMRTRGSGDGDIINPNPEEQMDLELEEEEEKDLEELDDCDDDVDSLYTPHENVEQEEDEDYVPPVPIRRSERMLKKRINTTAKGAKRDDQKRTSVRPSKRVKYKIKEGVKRRRQTWGHLREENFEVVESDPDHLQCKHCSELCRIGSSWLKHLKMNHASQIGVQLFTCSRCGAGFLEEAYLNRHVHLIHRDWPWRCKGCTSCFQTEERLEAHMSRKHPNGIIRPVCEYCGTSFVTKTARNNHCKKFHSEEMLSGQKPATSLASGGDHQPRKKRKYVRCKPNKSSVFHECEKCDFKSTSKEKVQRHGWRHLREENFDACEDNDKKREGGQEDLFRCKHCSATCPSRALAQHLKERHASKLGVDLFTCDRCGTGFFVEQDLSRHVNQVHRLWRFSCKGCTSWFESEDKLKAHMERKHPGGLARHICEHCGDSFGFKSAWKRHVKKFHSAEEISHRSEEECKACGLKLVSRKALNLHVKASHAEVYKFECDLCDARYTAMRHLVDHKEAKHSADSIKKRECPYCHKEFSSRKSLEFHWKRSCRKYPGKKFKGFEGYGPAPPAEPDTMS